MAQSTASRRLSAGPATITSAHRATASSIKPDPIMSRFKDIRFQAKAMASSLDSFDFSLLKSNQRVERVGENPKADLNQKARKSEKKEASGDNGSRRMISGEKSKEFRDGHQWSSKKPVASVTSRVGGRRRSSFGGSIIELADIFASSGVKVVSADMPPFMQLHAVDCARRTHDSIEKFTSKTLASTIKKEFDEDYGPAWHCIVGKSFGSYVTYSGGGFLYFSMDQKLSILLFKTTVQRAA